MTALRRLKGDPDAWFYRQLTKNNLREQRKRDGEELQYRREILRGLAEAFGADGAVVQRGNRWTVWDRELRPRGEVAEYAARYHATRWCDTLPPWPGGQVDAAEVFDNLDAALAFLRR